MLGKEIELRHVPTADQIADIFMKLLSRQSFVMLRERLGVLSLASFGLRGCDREPCKDHLEEGSKVVCNAAVHELHGVAGHVRMKGARDMVKAVPLPPCTDQESALDIPNKSVDHKCTCRDIVVRSLLKEKA